MADLMPIFPLNLVAYPGMTVPLHVFEQRYRAMVRHLLGEPDRTRRLFGIVAIREGYEVGSHEARSMYRTGCVMQLGSVEEYPDGRFDVAAVGRHRMRVVATETSRPFLLAEVERLPDDREPDPDTAREAALALAGFEEYRRVAGRLSAELAVVGRLPRDPELLSYTLAAGTALTLAQRQQLLESATSRDRLALLRRMLGREVSAMRAVPSLPATEVARSGWNPN
jgi:uncharacterized protein